MVPARALDAAKPYSFWVEEESYDFSTVDLVDLQSRSKVTTVFDWSVEQQTCKEAQENVTSYACSKAHSFCLDSDNGPGYRCRCSPGYQSNPYIPSGCQDVDECADPMLNDCEERSCINQKGSYTCACPRDYYGDGQKNGEGCAGYQLRVIKIVAGSAVGLVLLLASGGWFYLGLKKRKLIKLKKHYFQQNGGLMLQKQLLRPEGSIDTTKIFTEEELKMATNNFDESRIIGRGGYGTVYKAELPDQRVVAMKKSKIVDRRQNDQFINEVVVLLQRQKCHCLFMNLSPFVPSLTISTKRTQLPPPPFLRTYVLKIATETAGVLSYLHSGASTPIIHGDIKSTNILLDDNYTAKMSDFGLSRLVSLDQAQLSTVVQGTVGYLDPEEGDVEEVKEFASLAQRCLRVKGEESSSRTRGSDYYGIGRAVMGWRGIEFKSDREFWW
ncbi:hypothetical protein L3X38_007454 [Prunus dulcis]|uniref:Uncharacterized protein n=1 Tax=Prunus dulcis TaxID=3755 RepID=A0AAD5F626_PRUDU|nr:hypothetical protein L3X38_007454 [Prunus dulcis]